MAKAKEDRQISDAEIRKNVEAAGTIKKLQHELEVLRRQSDENNVASFMEKDFLREKLKKKETKELDLQKELKSTKIAKNEIEARLKDKIEKEVRLQEENENLKRIINEKKEPIDEMRKKLVGDMKSHFGKFADCFLPTNDKIESWEGASGSGSNQQNLPSLTGIWLELQKTLDGLDLNGASPEAGSPQLMGGGGGGNGYSASSARPFESTKPRNMGPPFGLNGPAEPTVPQPIGRSPPQITFPPGNPRITISQPGDIVNIVTQEVWAKELCLGAPEVSISQTPQTNKPKDHLKEEHNRTPGYLNDDQVKI